MITITYDEFQDLASYIKQHFGIHIKDEKQTLLTGRLHNILVNNGFGSYSEYYKYLTKDKTGIASSSLIDKISTNHTFFMREAEHFKYLKEEVLPQLKKNLKDKDLRIWSAGCSSGEEPYTIAMLLDMYFEKEKALWDTKVLATDISDKVLDRARKGVYSYDKLINLPNTWKLNYFNRMDNDAIISDKIKQEVIFRKFNLMEDEFPFKKKFHVIFCRNVMIYFDSETRSRLIRKLYSSLVHGGYLFIGHSESLTHNKAGFRSMIPAVYEKI